MSAVAVAARAPAALRTRTLRRLLPAPPMLLAIGLVILLVLVLQGYNMLHYPYLENDEGTYISQAWSVFHLGRLAPYTYFYDHAPLGWIQIAFWQLVTANHSFGYALASGRVLMLLYQLGSALLVLAIAKRCSGKLWVGLLAAVLFCSSTYGINYHRRILLDNIATFWLLVSIHLLVGRFALRRVWLSAAALGVAVLSKEVAVAALPALAVLVARQSPRSSRPFAVTGWLALALGICSTYILLALLKGEFFPYGTGLGGHHPHVSLLCTLQWQAARGADGGILNGSSGFWHYAREWAYQEPLLVIGGSTAALLAVSVFRRQPVVSMLGWMVLSLWLFLGRGGLVIGFYLVPLLPLLALCLALIAGECVKTVRRRAPHRLASSLAAGAVAFLVCVCSAGIAVAYERSDHGLFTKRPVDGQVRAIRWIRTHLSPQSTMIIDMYMYADLHYPEPGSPSYRHAEWYWKAAEDPEVNRGVFHGNWRNVDYVIATPQLVQDASLNDFPLVVPALEHSVAIASFNSGGWDIEVRRVDPRISASSFATARRHPSLPSCMTST